VVATSAADPAEPELVAAAGRLWNRTDLLARVLACRPSSLGVTGTHGKGTVTALAAAAVAESGLDPLAVVGVQVPLFDGYARLGGGPVLAEVDDSDLAIRRVAADVALVTNLDLDHPHLDTPLARSVEAIGEFVSKATLRVVLGPSPRAAALAAYARTEVWRYGREVTVRVVSRDGQRTTLDLRAPDGVRERAVVSMLGGKTEVNAGLAFAAALSLGAAPGAAAAGLGRVTSLYRRLEVVGERDGVTVVDDFGGKHPATVRAGIAALRQHFPGARVVAVFEPYAPFLSRWSHRYAERLGAADHVVLVPPVFSADYSSGRPFDAAWGDACPVPTTRVGDRAEAVAAAMGLARPGDVVVFFAQLNTSRTMAESAVGGAAS
jgi:UDP-N-acetylmuramate--alanine ligase